MGFKECECCATSRREKSDRIKANKIDRNPIITSKNTIGVINTPVDIHSIHPFILPKIKTNDCETLKIKDKMTQK